MNTISGKRYIFDNVLYSLVAMVLYSDYCFTSINRLTQIDSRIILYAMVVALVAFGVIITYKDKRNMLSTAVNILIPCEIYTIIAYYKFISNEIIVLAIIAASLSLVYLTLKLINEIQNKPGNYALTLGKVLNRINSVRIIVTACFMYIIIAIVVSHIQGQLVTDATAAMVPMEDADSQWTIENNMDTLELLNEDSWTQLDTDERMEVLMVVIKTQMHHLGINHEIYFAYDDLKTGIAACYDDESQTITIRKGYLDKCSAIDVLRTICHECYHSYCYLACEMYPRIPQEYRDMLMFRNIPDFLSDIQTTTAGIEDIASYLSEPMEKAAREYASEAVKEYYNAMSFIDTKED